MGERRQETLSKWKAQLEFRGKSIKYGPSHDKGMHDLPAKGNIWAGV